MRGDIKQILPELPINWATIETETAQLLSHYLQFDTSNPPGQEALAIEFLAELLQERGFSPQVLQSAPDRANLVVRLTSPMKTTAPPLLLYAHADVVPANATDWSIPPFGGLIQDGFVWGRGALDDKGLGIIFVQVLTLLKQHQVPLQRDIILLIAADEEANSRYGVSWLLDHHLDLVRAEYVWDEGGIGLRQEAPAPYLYGIAVAEKNPLTVKLSARGTPGHAALPHTNNPQERLVQALGRIKRWERPLRLVEPVVEMLRVLAETQPFPRSYLFNHAENPIVWSILRPILQGHPFLAPIIQDTISLTMLRGGESTNVVSAHAEARLDIRLLPDANPEAVLADLRSVIGDRKVSVEGEAISQPQQPVSTQTDFYQALVKTLQSLAPPGLVLPYLTPGATDSRFFRQVGMKSYGFMPMLLDGPELSRIHGIDERVSTANLRWGIQFVFETLRQLG